MRKHAHKTRIATANPQRNVDEPTSSFRRILAAQGGVCGSCKKPETATTPDGQLRLLNPVKSYFARHAYSGALCKRCMLLNHVADGDPIVLFALGSWLVAQMRSTNVVQEAILEGSV